MNWMLFSTFDAEYEPDGWPRVFFTVQCASVRGAQWLKGEVRGGTVRGRQLRCEGEAAVRAAAFLGTPEPLQLQLKVLAELKTATGHKRDDGVKERRREIVAYLGDALNLQYAKAGLL
jgi:hypothetical protein